MRGRPTDYNEALVVKLLTAIAESSSGLAKICKENPDFPAAGTIRRWISEKEDFRDRYARAKEQQADFLADEIVAIADEIAKSKSLSHEKVGAARLQIDSRKWIASKLKPKYYGDKTDITSGGEKIKTPEAMVFISADKLTDEQIEKFLNKNDRINDESI